jgi:glutathione synthase/RimK-type ligase-like ATP-grasp enzyme
MATPRRAVLLLTHSADHFTVDRVLAGVARRGAHPVRLDSDRFPAEYRLTTRVSGDGMALRLHTHDVEFPVASVASVWMRRIFGPPRSSGLTDLEADQCVRESRAALEGFLSALHGAHWLDPLAHVREAENKLVQLREAQRAGLHVPRTVVGNDPDEVRALWAECRGQLVAKMLTPVTRSMGPPAAAVYTHTLSASDLDDLEGLALAPMIFQERIDKLRELRVVYVAGRCFVGSLEATSDDWRKPTQGSTSPTSPWRVDRLPDDVAARLDAVMRALGLRFGVADFLAARDGSHPFLELNPVGEWGMLERDLDLPIADAIAEELCKQR